jgi:hypothetical protein
MLIACVSYPRRSELVRKSSHVKTHLPESHAENTTFLLRIEGLTLSKGSYWESEPKAIVSEFKQTEALQRIAATATEYFIVSAPQVCFQVRVIFLVDSIPKHAPWFFKSCPVKHEALIIFDHKATTACQVKTLAIIALLLLHCSGLMTQKC